MLAMTGAALVLASQAQAANPTDTYAADDLLLNFRNPGNITGSDLEVNLGPVSSLTSGVVATSALVEGVYGTIASGNTVGLSASAADASGTTGQLWMTRALSSLDLATGPTVANSGYSSPAQALFSTQNPIAVRIGNIGTGYDNGTVVSGFGNAATVPGATAGNSYQAQAEQSISATGTINFGAESLAASKGGTIETIQNGSGNVYEALWDIPVTGTAPSYEGYFTFKTDGEVDFTGAPSAVPEPATYGMFAGIGLAALAMRRQIRSLIA